MKKSLIISVERTVRKEKVLGKKGECSLPSLLVSPRTSYTWKLLKGASPDQWLRPGNEYLLQKATFGLWVREPVQLLLQLALFFLQPPLVLQELTLFHLQVPNLLLAGSELVLQFCQSGQQCITLWVGRSVTRLRGKYS